MTSIIVARPEREWEAVPRRLPDDWRLSLDTRGVAVWIVTRTDNFDLSVGGMRTLLNIGKDIWRRMRTEMAAAGYLEDTSIARDSGGKFSPGLVFHVVPLGGFPEAAERPKNRKKSKITAGQPEAADAPPADREAASPPPTRDLKTGDLNTRHMTQKTTTNTNDGGLEKTGLVAIFLAAAGRQELASLEARTKELASDLAGASCDQAALAGRLAGEAIATGSARDPVALARGLARKAAAGALATPPALEREREIECARKVAMQLAEFSGQTFLTPAGGLATVVAGKDPASVRLDIRTRDGQWVYVTTHEKLREHLSDIQEGRWQLSVIPKSSVPGNLPERPDIPGP